MSAPKNEAEPEAGTEFRALHARPIGFLLDKASIAREQTIIISRIALGENSGAVTVSIIG